LNTEIEKLRKEIKLLEAKVKTREQEIQGMHDRVADAERKCEKSLLEHQRRTKEIEKQF
jgi:predicted  nucleic acid-binding Zn-ribbon protein